jgi:hypothetical protein
MIVVAMQSLSHTSIIPPSGLRDNYILKLIPCIIASNTLGHTAEFYKVSDLKKRETEMKKIAFSVC